MANLTALFDLAVGCQRQGDLGQAVYFYRQILQEDARHTGAHNNLGLALVGQGEFDEAKRCFRLAVHLTPDYAHAHFNLGNVHFGQGDLAAADVCFRQVIKLVANHADAHNNLGNVLFGLGDLAGAAQCYRDSLQCNPAHPHACYNFGNVLVKQGQPVEATRYFRQALRINPGYADAHNNLGQTLLADGQKAEAILCFRQALTLSPRHADALGNLGDALRSTGQTAAAVVCYEQALQINPAHVGALTSLGHAFKEQGRSTEAIECYRRALRIDPGHADTHNNLGLALKDLGQFAESAACYQKALTLDPDHKIALWNRSHLRLLQGEFAGGWRDYEQRWHQPGTRPRSFQQPRWDGSALEGRTILVYAEQGLGDTIQFARHLRLVKEQGGRVLFECQPALLRLMAGVVGVDELVPQNGARPLPAFDVQIPLLSLPGLFGTTLENIPGPVPYVVSAAALVTRWRQELGAMDGFKIGIVWQGNPTQPDDSFRSVPLALFAPLAALPGVRLLSLQVGQGHEQLASATFPIVDLGSRFDPASLHDVAAVLPCLDLVITVCTSVAHLGGACGVPVWIALRLVPYWFWLLNRSDSPWYPTVRLFRQRRQGQWPEVFARLVTELQQKLDTLDAAPGFLQ